MADLGFTPVTEDDLPLLRRWLATPHWREWWGDDDAETALWRDMISGRDSTRPFLFHLDGEPVGYIQYWFIRDARVEPWITQAPWVAELPDDAIGVDLSIGPADLLSRGIGARALAAFVAKLRRDGHQTIIIDPDPANARAIRAYEKAGFRPIPEFEGRSGDCLLMRHQKESETA
ncbi:MAG: acetyltransferase [Paracoccus denitrificans]|uniref:Acetyltransferase n=1 Tax=Paracoccus denitrificans TaxID=266 RepID=A0A533I8I5_PARDE|nr:MAG: acetyltransferase [Paracoccus denitrificans]